MEKSKMSTKLTSEDIKDVIKMYKSGILYSHIAKKFNCSPSTIFNYLFYKNGLKKPGKKTLYSVNSSYFDTINTAQKAYWLGFLYADGCVHKTGVNLGLATVDIGHLEKYKKHIQFTGKIETRKSKDGSSSISLIRVGRSDFRDSLIKKGCSIRKTFTLTFPDESILPRNLYSHFIRGYFDGDGSVWEIQNYQKNVNKTYSIGEVSITSSDSFIHSISLILGECGIFSTIQPHPISKGISIIRIRRQKDVLLFRKYIYRDAKIFLERKKRKFYSLTLNKPYLIKDQCKEAILNNLKHNPPLIVKNFVHRNRKYTKNLVQRLLREMFTSGIVKRISIRDTGAKSKAAYRYAYTLA